MAAALYKLRWVSIAYSRSALINLHRNKSC